jgi:hypothetical protein
VLTSILRIRSLQNYVKKWKKEAFEAAKSGRPSAGFSMGNNAEIEEPTSSSSLDGTLFLCTLNGSTSNSSQQSTDTSTVAMRGHIANNNTFAAAEAPGNSTGSQSGSARNPSDGRLVKQAPAHAQPAALKSSWFSPTGYTHLDVFPSGFNCSIECTQGSDGAFTPPNFTQPSIFGSSSWRANAEQGNNNQFPEDKANGSVDWTVWEASYVESR